MDQSAAVGGSAAYPAKACSTVRTEMGITLDGALVREYPKARP